MHIHLGYTYINQFIDYYLQYFGMNLPTDIRIIFNIYIFLRWYVNYLYDIVDLNCIYIYIYIYIYVYMCVCVCVIMWKHLTVVCLCDLMPPCQSSIFLMYMYFISSFCTYFLITFQLLPVNPFCFVLLIVLLYTQVLTLMYMLLLNKLKFNRPLLFTLVFTWFNVYFCLI